MLIMRIIPIIMAPRFVIGFLLSPGVVLPDVTSA